MSTEQFMGFPDLQDWVNENPLPGKAEIVNEGPGSETIGGKTNVEAEQQDGQSWAAPEGAVSVELPSGFRFYDFKEMWVAPLKGKHLAKIAGAAKAKSVRLLAEAISSTLWVPKHDPEGPGLAFQLTIPDYFWILYFHRKTWYTKTSFNVTTRCSSTKHIKEVLEGKLKAETLTLKARVDVTSLKSTDLESVPELPECLRGLGFGVPRMMDMIMTLEDQRFGSEEFKFLFDNAAWVGHGRPWAERLALVEDLTPEQIMTIQDLSDLLSDYGVEESATVKCKECGASTSTILSIDAHSFLPAARSS